MPEHRDADFAEVTRSVALRQVPSILTVMFVFGVLTVAMGSTSGYSTRRPRYPDSDIGADSLPARKKAQLATVNQFKVFSQFQFSDLLKASGITFVHHAVDDVTAHQRPCQRPIFGCYFPQIFDSPTDHRVSTLSRTRSRFVMFLTRES